MLRTLLIALTAAGLTTPTLAQVPNQLDVQQAEIQAPIQRRIPQRGRGWNVFNNNVDIDLDNNQGNEEVAVAQRMAFDGQLTAAKIARAIDDGVLFLKRRQAADGSIGEAGYAQGGSTGLAALAMLAAGLSPLTDPQLKRALDYLAGMEAPVGGTIGGHGAGGLDNTYVRGIRANVWEYALRLDPENTTYRKALEADAQWLLDALKHNGRAWRYSMQSSDWDNSCSQYGVLGLWAAERAGIDPGDAFWQKMSEHFLSAQVEDGGWGYTTGNSSANMATAGLASTFLVFDMLHAKTVYRRENPNDFKKGDAAKVLASLERGMEWLGKQEGGMDNGYFLYGIERTGVASGRKYMGKLDWFREGARAVLSQQQTDGSIPNSYSPELGTAFSTLFLVYGGAPVALNKLEFGSDHDWNLNPRDLAQVAKHLWTAYERPLNWHTVSIDAPVEELEAPILFMSGTRAATLTDAQVDKLRDYIQRGGTILAEPSDHAPEFAASMEALVARLFPVSEYPGRTLAPIADTHPLFTATHHTWKARPQLRGVSDGSRLVFLLSDDYLSAKWQMGETIDESFDFALSLLFYVSDSKPLVGKFDTDLPETPAQAARDRVLQVARATIDATPDTDLGARTWARFAPWFQHRTGATVKDLGAVPLSPNGLQGVELLHLTGRRAFTLDEAEKAALMAYVGNGGHILVDAWGGAPEFALAARRELSALFGPLEPLSGDEPVVTGDFEGGSDLTRNLRYTLPARRHLQKSDRPVGSQNLLIARHEGRAAVFFSDLDLSAALAGVGIYQARGYRPDSARRILANLGGWLVRET